jgi:hypothetical protein
VTRAHAPRQRPPAGGSAKLARLLGELGRLREERPGEKALVYSQWTGLLDLAGAALDAAGVRQSHCRFRNRATEYVSESDMKWMSGSSEQ